MESMRCALFWRLIENDSVVGRKTVRGDARERLAIRMAEDGKGLETANREIRPPVLRRESVPRRKGRRRAALVQKAAEERNSNW
jgi:hypothetical protein